ncbi:ATP-dependent DNA helicase [Trichonephila inaurata madagascariensis]|uniref:ATP-dependent DNA helicase n=1 Tax=Trichonephila inaurata madagascariensis TaxID=2747483 RepID=A0A8X7CSE8_9ARAC|nr:ATP-dependent DNA helicase [Trichonephila inaurata madagascariensis]
MKLQDVCELGRYISSSEALEKNGKTVSDYQKIKKDRIWERVYTVHPGNAERYYLRLFLHKIRRPTSFTAIKIVAGVVQPSLQAACRALGLLEDDAHWNSTFEEALRSLNLQIKPDALGHRRLQPNYGGLTALLTRNIRQSLPVVIRGTRACFVKAGQRLSLRTNMRFNLQHDLRAEMFSKLLIDFGNGKINEVEGIDSYFGNITITWEVIVFRASIH